MRGKFIVIDGSDGSGKGTQTELVIKRLRNAGKNVHKCDFPQYDKFFGRMVGKYLNNEFGDATKVDPYLASLIYAGDRWQSKDEIKKALDEGKIVIANRYVPSNMAHQGCKLENKDEFFSWLENLEYNEYGIPKPDLVIILYVPVNISQELVDKKDKRDYTNMKRDGHESDKEYLSKTAELYKELAIKNNWLLIECVKDNKLLSKEEINNLIWNAITE